MKTAIKIPGDWYSIDFHVHSPASRCFRGPKQADQRQDDENYFWLLQQAAEADVDIVVITDHNEIAGYQKLLELKTDLESAVRAHNRVGLQIPEQLERQLHLFDEVILLPGVELDVDPNLHMLVIFDPSVSLPDLSAFIDDAGFPPDVRGSETVSINAEWNIGTLCDRASELKAIVIAAHVDSDKGLYEASKQWGQKRIAAFTNENLSGMEFNNPKSRDQIESLLKEPAYHRETPLSFVQSSDFHGLGTQIGQKKTYVRLDGAKRDVHSIYESLRTALRNPVEYVSAPGRPEIREIQRKLEDNPFVEGLTSESDVTQLVQYVCAYANSSDGTFVIGRHERGNWTGIQCESERAISNRIFAIIQQELHPIPDFRIEVYPYYGDRFFATVRIRKQPHIFSTIKSERAYVLEGSKPRQASIAQIVQQAEDDLLTRYAYLSISGRLSKISQRLGGTMDSIDVLPLVRKVDSKSIPFHRLFPQPSRGALLTRDLERSVRCVANGCVEGNISILRPVRSRLKDQYIRFTAPIGECDAPDELPRYSGEKIVVAPQGAAFFDEHTDIGVVCLDGEPLVCQPGKDYNGPDVKFVVAFLRSAVAIWYSDRCFNSVNFHDIWRVLPRIPIPEKPPLEYEQRVLSGVTRLISLEHEFLEAEQVRLTEKPKNGEENGDEWEASVKDAVNEHNAKAGSIMAELDVIFFELFDLNDEEVEIVQKGVEAAGMMVFNQ